MKPTLQLIHNSATEERTWVIGKPYARLERILIKIVPVRKDRFESQGNGSCNGFGQRIIRSCSSDSGTA
jgi:hypothetical protein